MAKTELELRTFNLDRFNTLWKVEWEEKAMLYAKECDEFWKNYIASQNEWSPIEISNGIQKVQDNKSNEYLSNSMSEQDEKEELVKKLRESWMKLASTKRNIETLREKVASLTQ